MTRRAWLGWSLKAAALAMAFGLALAALFAPPGRAQNAEDQGILAGFVSRLLSTPTSRVSIGAVEGALSSDATIRNVSVADDSGVYLTIDRIRLVWRRAALLQRRVEIQQLEIGQVTLSRRPATVSGAPEPGPILPELPLSLEVGAFRLGELILGEPVIGAAARLGASGSASLGAPAQGLRAAFEVRRLDAAGAATLALTFVPQGERLDLNVRLDEPAGGLLARVASIPGAPPVRLDLSGAGTLDDWRARLDFTGGPDLDARGTAILTRQGAERALTLDLQSRIAPLLPAVASPVFEGVTALSGDVRFIDGGAVALRNLRLASSLAELTVAGMVAEDRSLDLSARARAVPNAGNLARVGEGQLERLNFEGTVKGPYVAPAIAGSLDLAGLVTPALSIGALAARFSADPLAGGMTRLDAEATARAVLPADQGLAEALGRDLSLNLSGEVDAGGVARFERARLSSPTLALDFAGRLGRTLVEGRLGAEILRLDAFSTLAGRPLAGRAQVSADLAGDPSKPEVAATLRGAASGLTYGDERLQRLAGGSLALEGSARLSNGAALLRGVRLTGAVFSANLDGSLSASALDLDAGLRLASLERVDARLGGAAEARLKLTGPAADPSALLTLTAAEATAMGRPVRNLDIRIDASRIVTAPALAFAANGAVNGKPLKLGGRLSATEAAADGARRWALDGLDANLGSVSLKGGGRLEADGFAAGRATLIAGELDDLTPLALTKLDGRLSAELSADSVGGRQSFAARADGERLQFGEIRVARLGADLALNDVWRSASLRGSAEAAGLQAAGENFERVALTASDAGGGASAVSVEARARGFALSGSGRIEPGAETVIRLSDFRATRNGRAITLAGPAAFRLTEGGARTEGVEIEVAGGRVSLSGLVGRRLDAAIRARALPLSAADIVAPGLGLAGTLNAEATLSGEASAPRGPFQARVTGLSLPATRSAGAPALDVEARGTLQGDGADFSLGLRGGRTIDLRVEGSAAFAAAGPIALSARGSIDAGLANAQLGAGRRLAGRLVLDASARGSRARPELQGSASLSGGSFTDAAQGVALSAIEGRFSARGDVAVIDRLTARTAGGGSLSASGRITIDPARGFPADLRVTGAKAELIDSGLARLVANLDLSVNGALATAPTVRGNVRIVSLDVRVPENLGGASQPLRDARHVAPPPQTRARLAQIARANQGARRGGPPFRAALDLTVDAPGRIFVRGRGLDAELGGTLRLTGTTLSPIANGAFDLRRGRLTILTQRLDFSRGRIAFAGAGLVPELDFLAETRAGDVTARVAVTGPADAPAFAFSSTPALPEDEVLSRLLFARAAGGLSPFQAIQLAQAAAQLSGGGGPDVFENARRALGVDDLDIGVGDGGPTVGLSRAISDRIRIGVRAGARPENTGVGVDIDLTRRLRLQSEIGADGRASTGIAIEQEY
jgi:translocation and assembly module TamB